MPRPQPEAPKWLFRCGRGVLSARIVYRHLLVKAPWAYRPYSERVGTATKIGRLFEVAGWRAYWRIPAGVRPLLGVI